MMKSISKISESIWHDEIHKVFHVHATVNLVKHLYFDG